MLRKSAYFVLLLLAVEGLPMQSAAGEGAKELSGMSVVGDHESPKSLVIVPWKSAELGDALDVSRLLDDGRQPVDREVFMRRVTYYELRAKAHEATRSQAQ